MKDNFSKQASSYAEFRPHYPGELYEYLYNRAASFNSSWDVGTGNGQVARILANRFSKVYATDISKAQIQNAVEVSNIEYIQSSAEKSGLPDHSVDLITIAQAIHWFDPDKFYDEVKRVARPNALLAYWAYGLPRIDLQIDSAVLNFHDNVIGKYWDPERDLWRNEYNTIRMPLNNLAREQFEFITHWSYEQFEGYLTTWSAVQHCISKTGINPVFECLSPFKRDWQHPKEVIFSIFLYAGVVQS